MYPTTEDLKRLIMLAEHGEVDNARDGLREFTTRRPGVLLAWKWLADIAENPRERSEAIRRARFLAPGDPWVIEAQKHRMPPKLKNKDGAAQQNNIQDEMLPFRRLNAYGTPIQQQPASDNLYRPQNPGYTYGNGHSYASQSPAPSQPTAPQPRANFDSQQSYPSYRTELERLSGPYSGESRYGSSISASQPTAAQPRSAFDQAVSNNPYSTDLERLSRSHGEHRHVSLDSDYPISERHLDYSSVEGQQQVLDPNSDLLPTRPLREEGQTARSGMTDMLNGHGLVEPRPVYPTAPAKQPAQANTVVQSTEMVNGYAAPEARAPQPENRTTMPWLGADNTSIEYSEIEIVSEPEMEMDESTSPLDAIVEQTQKLAASSVTIPKSVFWLIIASTVVGVGLVAAALLSAGVV